MTLPLAPRHALARPSRLAILALLLLAGPALPQQAAPVDPPAMAADRQAERLRQDEALKALEGEIRDNAAMRDRLDGELARLAGDRAALSAALVATGQEARESEERMRAAESRLDGLAARDAEIRISLASRRALLTEVLAALQRLGRRPPPALLLQVDDVVAAIRGATLLGEAVPELKAETSRLAADLAELAGIRRETEAERETLRAPTARLAAERVRLAGLVDTRQKRFASTESEIAGQRARSRSLAERAGSLRELIDRLDREVTGAEAAGARLSAEAERLRAEEQGRAVRERLAAAAAREPSRLAPRASFAASRGALPRPVAGTTLRAFGAPDGSGGALRGIVLATRPRATVSAPADGTIAFAGPFRAYGRLLIIDAGDGYYLLLAGLERATVEAGQFVLAGEPLGEMGQTGSASAAMGVVEADGPVLYFELRKDGGPVDPGPWWATPQSGKARG